MHPLVEYNLPQRPQWAIEGIPSFFEKFIGYRDNENLKLELGFQNPRRIRTLGNTIDKLDLHQILTQAEENYENTQNSKLRMVSVFLWKQGKLKTYIDLIRNDKKNGYPTYFEAAFDKKLNQIEPLWEKYLQEVKRNREDISRIPSSVVFPNKANYEKFKQSLQLD